VTHPAQSHTAARASAEDWLRLIEREYLDDFIPSGGSATKFVSGQPAALDLVARRLTHAAQERSLFTRHLDPGQPRDDGKKIDIHRADRLFFEITRDVDWKAWANAQARHFLETQGIRLLPGRRLDAIDAIAADNGRASADLMNQYQREFALRLIRNRRLTPAFRSALAALGRAQLIPDQMTPTTEEVLIGWLRGQRVPGASAALKRIQVFGGIDQSSARHMLTSFCNWLSDTGHKGMLVVLDFRAYEHRRKPGTQRNKLAIDALQELRRRGGSREEMEQILVQLDAPPPVAYSEPAYLAMLQLLRRFIDEIESFRGMLLVVLASPRYYFGEREIERTYYDYDALQTRIGLEVHDRDRADLAASLVHLEDGR
jgi:hypothetical protein